MALPAHFHEQDQTTFVLSGHRRFVIGGLPVSIPPGEGVCIPGGMPHSSLSGPSEVVGINIYTAPGAYATSDLITALSDCWRIGGGIGRDELAILVEGCRRVAATPVDPDPHGGWDAERGETVRQAARLAGLSREGYSRRFSRLHGMPPRTFRLSEKLNEARRLLRAGEPIAAVAAEAGFADQSHLGRCFRRAFGVTPGQYRIG